MPWRGGSAHNSGLSRSGWISRPWPLYEAVNPSQRRIVGSATFNVARAKAGAYFNKTECFCFTEQALALGASVDMPVPFFVDPAI